MGNNPTVPKNPKGRPKGSANKANVNAREAIAAFVEGNVGRLNGLLDAIEAGIKTVDEEGNDKWIVRPDPKAAYDALMSVVEYHIPKLQRSEVTGKDGEAQKHEITVKYED